MAFIEVKNINDDCLEMTYIKENGDRSESVRVSICVIDRYIENAVKRMLADIVNRVFDLLHLKQKGV